MKGAIDQTEKKNEEILTSAQTTVSDSLTSGIFVKADRYAAVNRLEAAITVT